MIDKDWSNYQNKTYDDEACKLLIDFLNEHKITNAVDLGCGAGNETVYMIKKGINVTACDRQLNKELILNRLNKEDLNKINLIDSDFVNINIPKTQCLCSFFSIPFCNPKEFNNLWNKIYDSIEIDGYFIGQLFGDRDTWSSNDEVNTFTIEEAQELLKKYKVLYFKEVEFIRESDNKKWHYYDIIANKK